MEQLGSSFIVSNQFNRLYINAVASDVQSRFVEVEMFSQTHFQPIIRSASSDREEGLLVPIKPNQIIIMGILNP